MDDASSVDEDARCDCLYATAEHLLWNKMDTAALNAHVLSIRVIAAHREAPRKGRRLSFMVRWSSNSILLFVFQVGSRESGLRREVEAFLTRFGSRV